MASWIRENRGACWFVSAILFLGSVGFYYPWLGLSIFLTVFTLLLIYLLMYGPEFV